MNRVETHHSSEELRVSQSATSRMPLTERRRRIAWWIVTVVVTAVWVASSLIIGRALWALALTADRWILQVAVFAAVSVVPQPFIELVAFTAETLTPDLPANVSTRWFKNLGAFVGLIERPLLLGAVVAGYPQFIAVWLVFKGIAGYRVGLSRRQIEERRLFQLFLINNAMSLAGVGLGLLVWRRLHLPG